MFTLIKVNLKLITKFFNVIKKETASRVKRTYFVGGYNFQN